MSSNDPLIGSKLGDYEIVGILGQGGMARVYRGYDSNLDRYAAIKVIEPNLISSDDDEEYRERFQREARAIARLNHPRIVGVYQYGQTEDESLYYMAMGFVEGRDLRQILKELNKQGRYLSYAQILRIIRDIANALDYAHQQGVIHRDIKPSNIMVMADGHAVLTDFGLALNAQEGTIGNTFGSVHYIAPEQAVSSAEAVPQSDLYSLGIVLYEMLTGRVPFEDVSAMKVALKHISDEPPLPSSVNPRVTRPVEEVVNKLLNKDPERRYPNGLALVHALQGAFAVSAEEDTHEMDDQEASDPEPVFVGVSSGLAAEGILPPDDDDDDPGPVSWDTAPTLSDTSTEKPGSLPFSPLDEADRDALRARQQKPQKSGSGRGMLFAVIALVVIAVLVAGAVIASGALDGGEDDGDDTGAALAANRTATAEAVFGELTDEPVPTDTDEPEPTATGEVDPTATDEPEPTATDEPDPTDEPEPTATDEPDPTATDAPEPTATATLAPDDIMAVPLEDLLDPDAYTEEVLLYYNGDTLVLYNRSGSRIDIYDLDFVRVNPESERTTTFRADEWDRPDNNLSFMRARDCYQVWTTDFLNMPATDAPADICLTRQGLRQTSRPVWTSSNPESRFEVRLDGDVLAECPTTMRGSDDLLRCLVDLPD